MAESILERQIAYVQDALNRNFTQRQIANALNVPESTISEFIATHNIRKEVPKEVQELDDLYDALELRTLKRLDTALQMETNPMRLLAAAKTLNGAKRRGKNADLTEKEKITVPITLPQVAVTMFVYTANNEAIAVTEDGVTKPLMTASKAQLDNLLENRHAISIEEKAEVALAAFSPAT